MGRFSIDIAFPNRKIAIEVNGRYWHNLKNGVRRDRNKKRLLKSLGWKLVIVNATKESGKKVLEALNG
jgi:very-short-patch-repair endonuclease